MKLLLVDSDCDLVEMLTSWLKTLGFEVFRAFSGERACREWEQQQPDLVIIDPMLKDINGLMVVQQMSTKHDALVLVMTDSKDVTDEIRCLEAGADDYLRKPFFPSQLLAHVHAVNRRGRSTLVQRPSSIVAVGPIWVDSLRNQAIVGGKTVCLTPTESKLLYLLAVNANTVCTSNQIASYLWGVGNEGDVHLIKAHIRHLRLKIESDPGHPAFILTISSVGYTFKRPQEGGEH
ncbi:MAG TPA: response regulator transcription factor, partial [Ktedonobacteraceae bacterium]